jgi:hypothetical protein
VIRSFSSGPRPEPAVPDFRATGSPAIITCQRVHPLSPRWASRSGSALGITPASRLVMSDRLVCFALWAAFPPSLAGRNSCDYYQTSVAVGLASRRRSHVRPCRTCRAERRRPTHLLECPHWASPCTPEVASANERYQRRARHRFRRLSGGWRLASTGDLASGNPALTIFRGSRNAPPRTPGHDRCFPGMLWSPKILSNLR